MEYIATYEALREYIVEVVLQEALWWLVTDILMFQLQYNSVPRHRWMYIDQQEAMAVTGVVTIIILLMFTVMQYLCLKRYKENMAKKVLCL